MQYAPRTIAFLCELLHPPRSPDPAAVQEVHDRMFKSGRPAYSSFAVAGGSAVLTNPATRPGAVSTAAFLPDRFQFREELSSLTHDAFAERVRNVAGDVAELLGLEAFAAQNVTVRTLVNPRAFKDSRALLRDGLGLEGAGEAFGRDPQLYGLRLVFPPVPDRPEAFALRVESFGNDPRSLYIENQGTFPGLRLTGADAPREEALARVEHAVHRTYEFLVGPALRFVAGLDHAPKPGDR